MTRVDIISNNNCELWTLRENRDAQRNNVVKVGSRVLTYSNVRRCGYSGRKTIVSFLPTANVYIIRPCCGNLLEAVPGEALRLCTRKTLPRRCNSYHSAAVSDFETRRYYTPQCSLNGDHGY